MSVNVDIDSGSGFCAGVIRAITRAEQCLAQGHRLYSLGAIVHNGAELRRLEEKGMTVISEQEVERLPDASGACGVESEDSRVCGVASVSGACGVESEASRASGACDDTHLLIRAHGAPPQTYELLRRKGLTIVDCTCPVVLKLQKDIRRSWEEGRGRTQIVIFGKVGHAEVLGLVGQTDSEALVIENMAALEEAVQSGRLDLGRPAEVFSQTTKNPVEYAELCAALKGMMPSVKVNDTICSQVATRHERLAEFARTHDVIVFVAGKESSNGKVLFDLCREHNPRTWHAESEEDLRSEWFSGIGSVGVCGATSTPKWLLERTAQKILQLTQ